MVLVDSVKPATAPSVPFAPALPSAPVAPERPAGPAGPDVFQESFCSPFLHLAFAETIRVAPLVRLTHACITDASAPCASRSPARASAHTAPARVARCSAGLAVGMVILRLSIGFCCSQMPSI